MTRLTEKHIGHHVTIRQTIHGRESFSSGTYQGVRPSEHTGKPVHVFTDGEINGIPQGIHAFPADQDHEVMDGRVERTERVVRTAPEDAVSLDGFIHDLWRGGNCSALVAEGVRDAQETEWEVVVTDAGGLSIPTADDDEWMVGVCRWDDEAEGHVEATTTVPAGLSADEVREVADSLMPTARLV